MSRTDKDAPAWVRMVRSPHVRTRWEITRWGRWGHYVTEGGPVIRGREARELLAAHYGCASKARGDGRRGDVWRDPVTGETLGIDNSGVWFDVYFRDMEYRGRERGGWRATNRILRESSPFRHRAGRARDRADFSGVVKASRGMDLTDPEAVEDLYDCDYDSVPDNGKIRRVWA